MQKSIYELLAMADGLTTYHYRVLFMLIAQDGMTQSQLAEKLDLNRQNCHKTCKELLNRNIIFVSREEGKNKYLSINEKIKDTGVKGQYKLGILNM